MGVDTAQPSQPRQRGPDYSLPGGSRDRHGRCLTRRRAHFSQGWWPTSGSRSGSRFLTLDAMRQDPTFKDIFAYGFMVEELLRWYVAGLPGGRELVDALDFSKLLRVQEQSTSGPSVRKRSYANDIVWRVPFRDRAAGDAESAWLHLILMIEVQGTVDISWRFACATTWTTITWSCGVADDSAQRTVSRRCCPS